MKASQLVQHLQEFIAMYGDREVGIRMNEDQRLSTTDIVEIWPLAVSDRGTYFVIECRSILQKIAHSSNT